jgi:hypothetical protein
VQVYNKKLDLFFSLPLVSLLQTCSAAVDIGIRQSNPIAKGGREEKVAVALSVSPSPLSPSFFSFFYSPACTPFNNRGVVVVLWLSYCCWRCHVVPLFLSVPPPVLAPFPSLVKRIYTNPIKLHMYNSLLQRRCAWSCLCSSLLQANIRNTT